MKTTQPEIATPEALTQDDRAYSAVARQLIESALPGIKP
jgi:hypothetical protein